MLLFGGFMCRSVVIISFISRTFFICGASISFSRKLYMCVFLVLFVMWCSLYSLLLFNFFKFRFSLSVYSVYFFFGWSYSFCGGNSCCSSTRSSRRFMYFINCFVCLCFFSVLCLKCFVNFFSVMLFFEKYVYIVW